MKKIIFCFILIFTFATSTYASNRVHVTLADCVDGDTAKFYINNTKKTVRFLAIDTPEVKHPTKGEEPYGKEASNFTCQQLKTAKKIEIEYDSAARTDKYNRELAWIFIDNALLQEKLIKKGLAKTAYLYDDYTYTKILELEETKAKFNKIGIWGDGKEKEEMIINFLFFVVSIIIIIVLVMNNKLKPKKIFKKLKKISIR